MMNPLILLSFVNSQEKIGDEEKEIIPKVSPFSISTSYIESNINLNKSAQLTIYNSSLYGNKIFRNGVIYVYLGRWNSRCRQNNCH